LSESAIGGKILKNATGSLREGSDLRMSEFKIARFVGIEACKRIFSEKSTFVLRSPEHYRRLYETNEGETDKGDRAEGCAETLDGGTAEFKGFVASCWTKLRESEPTSDEWDIFKENDQNIVAIVSSPSKVCKFLDKARETDKECTNRRFPFHPVEHKGVSYEKEDVDHTNITDVSFMKGKQFTKQQEYRFVLTYGWPNLIDSFIFCSGIDYMEKCFANPEICKEQKEKLRLIIMKAMAGYGDFEDKEMADIIANADILFE
jgi:hypothetical protein